MSGVIDAACLTKAQAAAYLGMEDPRWMDDAPIPWYDLRKAGATRAVPRWRQADLDSFVDSRRMLPRRVRD